MHRKIIHRIAYLSLLFILSACSRYIQNSKTDVSNSIYDISITDTNTDHNQSNDLQQDSPIKDQPIENSSVDDSLIDSEYLDAIDSSLHEQSIADQSSNDQSPSDVGPADIGPVDFGSPTSVLTIQTDGLNFISYVFKSTGIKVSWSMGDGKQITQDNSIDYAYSTSGTKTVELYSYDGRSTITGLHFYNSNIVGNLPTDIQLFTNLTSLWTWGNNFNASIPSFIGNLSQMGSLQLPNNNYSGNIPTEIGNLSKLYSLDLSANNLTGSIPRAIGALSQLTNLELQGNNLSGAIPKELGNLNYLSVLDLSHNSFTGIEVGAFTGLHNIIRIQLDDAGLYQAQIDHIVNEIYNDRNNYTHTTGKQVFLDGASNGQPGASALIQISILETSFGWDFTCNGGC